MRPYQHATIIFCGLAAMLVLAHFQSGLPWKWLAVLSGIYLHLLVLGAIFIRWNFYLPSYSRGARTRCIALTFDDGPAEETERILDILKGHRIAATFFSIGKNAAAHPEIVKRWHDEGHLIGNHSYNHGFNFDWKSTAKMVEEIEQTNKTIKSITGQAPTFFRPPYGVTNPNLARAVKKTGMLSVGWSIRSFDTATKDKNWKKLVDRILDNLEGGDIILLHDSEKITREILTSIIYFAWKKGFTFVRVDEMLEMDKYA